MNRKENKILNAVATLLTADGYNFRTMKAIAEKAGESIADIRAVATNAGFDTCKTRRSDGAPLVGFGGNNREEVEVLAAISTALMDERYDFRTAKAVAEDSGEDDESYVLEVADNFGYDVSKKRRRDSAKLIGLSA